MRNFLIIVGGVLLLNAVFLYSGGFEYLKAKVAPPQEEPRVKTDINEVFMEALQREVREQVGTPIEGYVPQMFLQAFPGLTATDFDGVDASIGKYVVVDGRLEHDISDGQLIHSAAGAITRKGMATLLQNIARRTGIDLHNGGTLTDIMNAITAP